MLGAIYWNPEEPSFGLTRNPYRDYVSPKAVTSIDPDFQVITGSPEGRAVIETVFY